MSENKKDILFTYTDYTAPTTLALMKRLLAMFPEEEFTTHLLKLYGDRPHELFQNYVKPLRDSLHLHFNFDCLGFNFCSFDGTPYFNTFWTPCVTYLTIPAAKLDRELRREMNLNITLLCMTKSEEQYIREHYPDYEDVRTVVNPLQSIQPLYSVLRAIADRYPLKE